MTRDEAKRKAWDDWHDMARDDWRDNMPIGTQILPLMNFPFECGFDAGRDSIEPEVRSVLKQLDGRAEVWGDEAVFRRCRDRLRAIVGEP